MSIALARHELLRCAAINCLDVAIGEVIASFHRRQRTPPRVRNARLCRRCERIKVGNMAIVRILKLTVLASGELQLDGIPTTLPEIERVITKSEGTKLTAWYYREHTGNQEPPVAMELMKLLAEHRLPIRLCSNPDFSDAVADVQQNLERAFASVREKAAGGQVVILRPDGRVLGLPALQNGPPEAMAAVEKILPSQTKRNVAVIGDTDWTLPGTVDLPSANQAIPFFGLLLGFACLGHAVWIFNPKVSSVLSAACRDADVLIVDSASCSALPAWLASFRSEDDA